MLKFLGFRGAKNLGGYKSPQVKFWFNKTNEYIPTKGRDYGWVWEYAQFRFSIASSARATIEAKSLEVLKFVSVIAAGAWAVFEFATAKGRAAGWPARDSLLLASIFLLLAGGLALAAFGPAEHIWPVQEDKALGFADMYLDEREAKAKISLALAASSAHEVDLVSKKGKRLRCALISLILAALFFIIPLAAEVFR